MDEIYETLLLAYEKSISKIAEKTLTETKNKCKTYGDLHKEIKKMIRSFNYTNPITLVTKLEELLEKEMNDLPLTDRSK